MVRVIASVARSTANSASELLARNIKSSLEIMTLSKLLSYQLTSSLNSGLISRHLHLIE